MADAKKAKKYLDLCNKLSGRGLAKHDYDDDDLAVFALLDTMDESLEEHDDRFHNPNHEEHGHFDPETMTCGKRKDMAKDDGGDNLKGASTQPRKLSKKEQIKALILKKRPDIGFFGGKLPTTEEEINHQRECVDGIVEDITNFPDSKSRKAALHWFLKGSIRMPEDAPKVKQAMKLADESPKRIAGYREVIANFGKTMAAAQANLAAQTSPVKIERAKQRIAAAQERYDEAMDKLPKAEGKSFDPLSYSSPMAMIEALHEFKPKAKPIDPDTVSELSDKQVLPMGVTTYLVQDDRQGQEAMRKIINTHWGEDANPWCLLHGDGHGNLSDGSDGGYDAWHYWKQYNALPKRVAFKDGKLLAFMATDDEDIDDDILWDRLENEPEIADGWNREECNIFDYARYNHPEILDRVLQECISEQWWDRQDKSHEGIPLGNIPVPNDQYGRWADFEIRDGKVHQKGKFYKKLDNGSQIEWCADGYITRISNLDDKGRVDAKFYKDGKLESMVSGYTFNEITVIDGEPCQYYTGFARSMDIVKTEGGYKVITDSGEVREDYSNDVTETSKYIEKAESLYRQNYKKKESKE